MYRDLRLDVPEFNITLTPGCRVRLGRFETTVWVVSYGWYSWGGNRPQCGWFLFDETNPSTVKPFQLPDLDDIYFVER